MKISKELLAKIGAVVGVILFIVASSLAFLSLTAKDDIVEEVVLEDEVIDTVVEDGEIAEESVLDEAVAEGSPEEVVLDEAEVIE